MLEKIAEMPESDRAIAERLHAVITASAPDQQWPNRPELAWVRFFVDVKQLNSSPPLA